MTGAVFLDRVDLRHCTTDVPLTMRLCRLDQGLTIKCANLRALTLSGAYLANESGSALDAEGVVVGDTAFLGEGFTATGAGDDGAVRLPGARIGGQLGMSGAQLSNDTGPALHADRVVVGDTAFLGEGFTATGAGDDGAVRLPGARIGGQLGMRRARLSNETGPALAADGVVVDDNAFLDEGFTATGAGDRGAVLLRGARIGGELGMRRARLSNETGPALRADRVVVTRSAFLDEGFTATGAGDTGAVRLPGARIGGQLVVGANVLRTAAVGGGRWVLDDMTYSGFPSVGVIAWLRFLRDGTVQYAAQPYQHLAGVCRAAGHDNEARRVLMAQRRDQVHRGDLSPLERYWAWFTGLTLGYGYQPWRAAVGLLAVLTLALFLVFTLGTRGDVLGPTVTTTVTTEPGTTSITRTVRMAGECDRFGRTGIAADIALPLFKIPVDPACSVQNSPAGHWFTAMADLLRGLAWAFAALFAAAFTSIIRKT